MLTQCWAIVCDVGPTLTQHWVRVHCQMWRLVSMEAVCVSRWMLRSWIFDSSLLVILSQHDTSILAIDIIAMYRHNIGRPWWLIRIDCNLPVTWRYQVPIPVGPGICHRGRAYTVLQNVQRHGVYSAAYGTVHYKEPLKSFEIRVGYSPDFGLPSVAICHDCAESDVKQYSYTWAIIYVYGHDSSGLL